MNKKRLTSLLLLLPAITIVAAMSFSAGPILQEAIAQAGISSAAGVSNQTAANNAMSSFLPPGLAKSIIDQARNTNATKYALQHAISATTAAMNKTAGMNATNAAGMNATNAAGMNATNAAGMNATNAAGMNATTAAGMNATTAAGMNKTAGMNASTAAGMNATTAAGMNKTAGMNASTAVKSVLNITRNTNATSFAANNIINATKNTTALKH
jgi:hypothetical protein